MNDWVSSYLASVHGPVHAGSGPQIINLSPPLVDSSDKSPRTIADDQLIWLWRHFVEPKGFGKAREVLELNGTVLLDGVPGSGRSTAARMLLYELRSGPDSFRELVPNEEDGRRLDPDRVEDDDRLMLDLSSGYEQLWMGIHDELSSFRAVVRKHRAKLVVVLPSARSESLRADLGQFRAEIAPQVGMQVLQRHLRLGGISPAETSPTPEALSEFLATDRPMHKLAELAELIFRIRTDGQGEGGFAVWCERAIDVLVNAGREVTKSIDLPNRGPQRALMLAVAMLHGTHADAVHRAASSLLRLVKYPQDECPLLERADLAERFREIEVEPDAFGNVRFKKPGYDAAVRSHFWNHMPELRDHLGVWVGSTVDAVDLHQKDRDMLVERFAALCLHVRYRHLLVPLVSRWTAESTNALRMRAVAQALKHGLDDDEHGRFFRRRIYDWSRETGLSVGLTQVLIAMCSKVIAVRYPDEAMVRLHHLARRQRQGASAFDTLVQLVREDHRLHRNMLDRVIRDMAEGHKWSVDIDLFLELFQPAPLTDFGTRGHALIAETPVRSQLAIGWSHVFHRRPHEMWSPYVQLWLRAACEDEQHRDSFVDVLVAGGGQRTDILARIRVIARDLDCFTTDEQKKRDRLTDLVLRKVDAAQGVDDDDRADR